MGKNPKEFTLEPRAATFVPDVDSPLFAVDSDNRTTCTGETIEARKPPALGATEAFNWVVNWGPGLLLIPLLAMLYGGISVEMAKAWWNDPNASHGLLVPPLAACIAWRRRYLTLRVPVAPDLRGLFWIAAGCLAFFIGKLGAEYFLSRISLVIVLAGLIHTFWGSARLRTLAFPLVLLATMVPLPTILFNSLAQPLQLFASFTATQVARIFGVAVYQDGNIIQLATTTLGVEEACSGLRSMSSLVIMALLLGFTMCHRLLVRIILAAIALPIAVFVNVLRVSGTAILADYNRELAMGFYHVFSGWLIFLLGIALVFASCQLLRRFMERTA